MLKQGHTERCARKGFFFLQGLRKCSWNNDRFQNTSEFMIIYLHLQSLALFNSVVLWQISSPIDSISILFLCLQRSSNCSLLLTTMYPKTAAYSPFPGLTNKSIYRFLHFIKTFKTPGRTDICLLMTHPLH